MPTPYRKPKLQSKPTGLMVTCPSCGRKGRAAKPGGLLRCSECGKEFKAGDSSASRRTLLFGILGLIAMVVIGYFSVLRGQRIDAEEKAKEAEEERKRKATQTDK
jgi:uncharacterized protein (DUF983 family)